MLISRLPQLEQGYSLDLDSVIFSRHGTQQQGAARGYHPRRPGRLSRHPLLAVLESAKKSGVGILQAEVRLRPYPLSDSSRELYYAVHTPWSPTQGPRLFGALFLVAQSPPSCENIR